MTTNSSVLVDSDFWLALSLPVDTNQVPAQKMYQQLKDKHTALCVTNLIVGEVATILSHRLGQPEACRFLTQMERSKITSIHISEKIDQQARTYFSAPKATGNQLCRLYECRYPTGVSVTCDLRL